MNLTPPSLFPFPLSVALLLANPLCFSQDESVVAYEIPPILRASDLFDEDLLVGPRHSVREEVTTESFTNTFLIDSDFGVFEAHGNGRLPERIREIYAIAGIRETKESEAYSKALEGAAKEAVDGAVDLFKDPLDSVKGAGRGAVRFLKGAEERARVIGQGSDRADDMKKYGSARREIAGRYDVDPYTSNEVLRTEIDALAQATGAGELTFTLIKSAIPGGLGTVVSGLSKSASLNEKLIAEGPFTLRAENRERLEEMGIAPALVEAFLDHPALNPKHQTVITHSLSQLEGVRNRAEFLRVAMAARSEQDAYFFQRCAELLVDFHNDRGPVAEIVHVEGLAAVVLNNGKVVLPQLLDYGSWTAEEDRISQSLISFSRKGLTITGHERVITGRFSPAAREALANRGIDVVERAFETPLP